MSASQLQAAIITYLAMIATVGPILTGSIILVLQHFAEIKAAWTQINSTAQKVQEHDHQLNGGLTERIQTEVKNALNLAAPPAPPAGGAGGSDLPGPAGSRAGGAG